MKYLNYKMWEICGVLLYEFGIALLSEVVSWYLVYRKEEFRRVVGQIERCNKLIEDKKLNSSNSAASSQTSTSKSNNKVSKKVGRAEDQLKSLTQQLMPFNMRVAMANMVVVLVAYQYLNAMFEGVIVGRLPFTPFSFMTNITHRTLPGEDYRDASAHLIFALTLMVVRTNMQKLMEHFQIKPSQPKQMSLWEMASAEADNIQSTCY